MEETRASAVDVKRRGIDPALEDRFRGVPRLVLIRQADQERAMGAEGEYRATLRLFRYPARRARSGSQCSRGNASASSRTTRVLRWITRVMG